MPDDDTPRGAAHLTIEDFIVREMRTGFRDVHTRIDAYRGEAQKGNAKLEEHIASCDRRYSQMLAARIDGQTNRRPAKDWLVEKLKERVIDYAIVAVAFLTYYALTHGAHIPLP